MLVIYHQWRYLSLTPASVENMHKKGFYIRRSVNQWAERERGSNIYPVHLHPEIYLPGRRIVMHECCHAGWLFQVRRYTYNCRGIFDYGLLYNQVWQEVCAEAKSVCMGGVGGSAGLQSFALFRPLPLLLPIPSHLCCPDPDHNLGGWCYRKPRTPGKIVLLHGDSTVFISSLTGCLKESGEGRQRVGIEQGIEEKEGRKQSDLIQD